MGKIQSPRKKTRDGEELTRSRAVVVDAKVWLTVDEDEAKGSFELVNRFPRIGMQNDTR